MGQSQGALKLYFTGGPTPSLLDLQRGLIIGEEVKDYWDTLHNLPYAWSDYALTFDDQEFWNEIFYNAPNPDLVVDWFLAGLPIEKFSPKYKFIKKMEERFEQEKAELLLRGRLITRVSFLFQKQSKYIKLLLSERGTLEGANLRLCIRVCEKNT